MAKADILAPFIKSWEGGFSNVTGDKGGATMKGVTLTTFRQVFGSSKTVEDLRRITDAQWMTVFKRYYWDRMQADGIRSQSIANLLVDWVWLSGAWGIKNAQKELGVTADGIVGRNTLAAINGFQTEQLLFNRLWRARQAYILRISTGSQKKFRQGWLNRLDAIRYGRLVCNGGKVIRY